MRNRIESELRACTAELYYLQSGVEAENSAKSEVYDLLTECENILYPVTVCYMFYLHIKQFKTLLLPRRQDSTTKPEKTDSIQCGYTELQIARIKVHLYDSVIEILNRSETILDQKDSRSREVIRILKGLFIEEQSTAERNIKLITQPKV